MSDTRANTSTPSPVIQELGEQSYTALPTTYEGLLQVLTGQDIELRVAAARAIVQMEIDVNEVVPLLIQNLYYSEHDDVRRAAAESLGTIGPDAYEAVPYLFITLLSDSVHVRRASAIALGKIQHSSAVPALAQMLSDKDVASLAAEAIEKIRGQSFVSEEERHRVDGEGQLLYVSVAKIWWREEGQFIDWMSNFK